VSDSASEVTRVEDGSSATLSRRALLTSSVVTVAACSTPPSRVAASPTLVSSPADRESDWAAVRAEFDATRELIHMAGMLIASHPRVVRDAIGGYRRAIDSNPAEAVHHRWALRPESLADDAEERVRRAVARYLEADARDIALTDSTTMGLGLIYGGINIRPGQEVLSAHWNHGATKHALRYRSERSGFTVRVAPLYEDPKTVSVDGVVAALLREIRPNTRVVAAAWVHSNSGLKLPIKEIGARIRELNGTRDAASRILFCVDGVHGFGVEDVVAADLGADFFAAGCHKWLFGPRGTGILLGHPDAWSELAPIFTSFSVDAARTPGRIHTPGGFHSFEHRWALDTAFEFHLRLGKTRIANRIHDLARHVREGLSKMKHVRMRTPTADALTSGIVCFEVDGRSTEQVLDELRAKRIVASGTPENSPVPRLSPGLLNNHAEVETTLAAISAMA
jgi:selenocysteine lyase/cysteine desulfurase